jgi:hypothetical protein
MFSWVAPGSSANAYIVRLALYLKVSGKSFKASSYSFQNFSHLGAAVSSYSTVSRGFWRCGVTVVQLVCQQQAGKQQQPAFIQPACRTTRFASLGVNARAQCFQPIFFAILASDDIFAARDH